MNNPTLLLIGIRVRNMRRHHYASLSAAATSAGLTKSTWSRLENGKLNFTYSTINRVSNALFMDVSELLE